jgi:cytochrome P450
MQMMSFAAMGLDPFPFYRMMRGSMPVAYDASRGFAAAFGYDDVLHVLSDHAAFSSEFVGGGPLSQSMISSDPPRHRQLRNLVNQAFTPRAVAALAPRIREIVAELLDQVAPSGRMDVIDDLAYPLPVIVIAELLGIPAERRAEFKRWSDELVSGERRRAQPAQASPGQPAEHGEHGQQGQARRGPSGAQMSAQAEMSAYFREVIAERRRSPGDDLISALLAAEIEGERLNEQELLGFCILLLVAGNETTTNLIGNAVLCFDEYPGVYERLQAQPDLIPSAVEETLRYRAPVQAMFRVVKQEVTLGATALPAGTRVLAWIGSANRDEAQFPNADRFELERTPNRHLAFGHGIHFCLGAPLARLEARIALEGMSARLGNLRRVLDVVLEMFGGPVVFGVRHLPVTFEA